MAARGAMREALKPPKVGDFIPPACRGQDRTTDRCANRELVAKCRHRTKIDCRGDGMFSLEHSKTGYWSDFAIYSVVIAGATVGLLVPDHGVERGSLIVLAAIGLSTWSLVEYAMHRFVLHGVEPFKSWHLKHHERPSALISAPTTLSASLIAGLVFAPALFIAGVWWAAALTLGFTVGYLAYAVCHHGTHHWKPRGKWLKDRKRWHAIHHRSSHGQCYGVTTMLWDRVFGTSHGQ
jgi:cyclopropane-fatty-acyl-phospholipid synthase